MSGKPYTEGVTELLSFVEAKVEAETEIVRLQKQLAAVQVSLKTMEDCLKASRAKIAEKLTEMDLKSQGNTGWEYRFDWFLGELFRQMKERS